MSSPVTILLDSVTALAEELRATSTDLAGEAADCRSATAVLGAALPGAVGSQAATTAAAWAGLTELLAGQCAALAGTLLAAVDSYRATDAALAAAVRDTAVDGGPR